jgi:RNA-directed DNA polymerase
MNEPGKSDKPVVPAKPANTSPSTSFWELFEQVKRVEGRGLAKENEQEAEGVLLQVDLAKQVERTQSRERDGATVPQDLHSALDRVRQVACRDKCLKFTSLWHHVYDIDQLRQAYQALKPNAAAGVDGETWQAYGEELESNLQDLSDRLARGAYRARPVKRVYIPKADGKQRPIGIPVLEDKIVQRAAVKVLNAIYETDFLGFSYGFRPGRSAHGALDALAVGIQTKKVSWLLDADIRGFFDTLDHEWLANVYLHYVFDLWADRWRKTQAHGDVIIVRYADDFVVGFQHESDARRFLEELRERVRQFNLELHADKTRVIEFGRFASERRERRGKGKPETFNFLGFTHICDTTRKGKFIVLRQTIAKRMQAKLVALKEALRRRMHHPVAEVGRWLAQVLSGHYRYFGVPRNYPALDRFRDRVRRLWHRTLNRCSQKSRVGETAMSRIAACWLPTPRICQPYPDARLRVIIQGKSPVR